jgi:hypothetical protein
LLNGRTTCRGKVLYTWMPFDNPTVVEGEGTWKDLAGCLRCRCITGSSVLRALACNSLVGTNYVIAFLLFIFIDKSDQYQLVRYVLYSKGMMSVGTGLLYTVVGVVTYMSCVDDFTCEDSLLARTPTFYPMVISWLASVRQSKRSLELSSPKDGIA